MRGSRLLLTGGERFRSKLLPLTDRVALGAKEGACETRSPLPSQRGEISGVRNLRLASA